MRATPRAGSLAPAPGRRGLAAALAGAAGLLGAALTGAPAAGHGAPVEPVGRVLACAPDGPHRQSAACRAAVAASGEGAFAEWDNVRVAGVRGRDREVIPDGGLCSGGIDRYAGLDLARDDWPATTLPAGGEVTVRYRTTIPHLGEFRLYLTDDGYDPREPLAWSDLAEKPFLTVTDPDLEGDEYRLAGKLPQGHTGRHVVLTIWQNSDTPDTYYSCSDVLLEPAAEAGAGGGSGGAERAGAAEATGTAAEATGAAAGDRRSRVAAGRTMVLLVVLVGAAGAAGVVTTALLQRRGRAGAPAARARRCSHRR